VVITSSGADVPTARLAMNLVFKGEMTLSQYPLNNKDGSPSFDSRQGFTIAAQRPMAASGCAKPSLLPRGRKARDNAAMLPAETPKA